MRLVRNANSGLRNSGLFYALAGAVWLSVAAGACFAADSPADPLDSAAIYPLTTADLALVLEETAPALQSRNPAAEKTTLLPGDWSVRWSAPGAGDDPIPGEPAAWKPDTGVSLDFDADGEEVMLEWRVGF
jgi:hypothetical protein